MSDGFILTGDPKMPSTGLREEVSAMVKANIKQLLVDAVADKVGHAIAVAAGKVHWREAFMRHMGAFWGNNRAQGDHLADVCYQFLDKAWRDQYPDITPGAFLDAVHVPSEQSQAEFEKEVEESWEVEIAGSQEAMERHYYGSARVRKGKDIFSTFWQKTPDDTKTH
jgi:hypothetical protein